MTKESWIAAEKFRSQLPVGCRRQRDVFGRFDQQTLEVRDEPVDVLFVRVPGAHQTAAALADEGVELPAFLPQGVDDIGGKLGEYGVRLRREEDLHFGNFL